jgi:nucleoside-diphosphate-sugar epimerase
MKILITGGAGNVGSVLIPYLQRCGHNVFCIDQLQGVGAIYQTADINHVSDLLPVFQNFKPHVVIHLAAMVSRVTCEVAHAITYATNVVGTANVAQLCRMAGARMLSFSTSEVYGNLQGALNEQRTDMQPNNLYGFSKLMAEQVVRYERTQGLDATIVRPFMFYHEYETRGEHRSALIRFADTLLQGGRITVHKDTWRSWMHLDDAVVVIEKLLTCNAEAVNIGHPDAYRMEVVAAMVCNAVGVNYAERVIEDLLPQKMTRAKFPDLALQNALTGYTCTVDLKTGINRIVERLRLAI